MSYWHTKAQKHARRILLRLSIGESVNGVTAPGGFHVPQSLKLFSTDSSKVVKGEKRKILTGILYLAPDTSGEVYRNGKLLDVCPWSTDGCRAGCLVGSGQMRWDSSANSRRWKTALYATDKGLFGDLIHHESHALQRRADRLGYKLALRLDGTSDLGLADLYRDRLPSDAMAYDYTKSVKRILAYDGRANRHLTFSVSEAPDSPEGTRAALDKGLSAAVIVPAKSKPDPHRLTRAVLGEDRPYTYVADGDIDDARYRDEPGSIVYLGVKGGRDAHRRLGGMVFDV